jgi:hypothetical protein
MADAAESFLKKIRIALGQKHHICRQGELGSSEQPSQSALLEMVAHEA